MNYKPEKEDPYRFLICVGGDRIHCPWDCVKPTVDMITVKLLLHIILLTPNAKFMLIDIKDLYLNTPMPCYKYTRIKLSDLPDDMIRQYNLRGKLTKYGYVYTETCRGMYGITAAGILL